MPEDWREAVVDDKGRVERIPYELCVLVALREAIRRREIWVVGANRWRNPEDDLPADFEDNRDVHYAALRQAPGPGRVHRRPAADGMRDGLDRLEQALADGHHRRGGDHDAQRRAVDQRPAAGQAAGAGEPGRAQGRGRSAAGAPSTCWTCSRTPTSLTGFTDEFTSVATREILSPRRAAAPAAAGAVRAGHEHGHQAGRGDRQARRVARPRCAACGACSSTATTCARPCAKLVNATFAARDPRWWGTGHRVRLGLQEVRRPGTSNLMTEWHQPLPAAPG